MKSLTLIYLFIIVFFMTGCTQEKTKVTIPAHSHNDYNHSYPLFGALDCGFRSVEADIYSIGDSIFVAHDFKKIKPGRTLQNMYLEPLKTIIDKNSGSVYGNGEELILLIDIKDDAERTYSLLHNLLENYRDYLTVFENGKKVKGGILVVISGNRPFGYMKNQTTRFAGWDGRLKDLTSGTSPDLMPMVSDNWNKYFKWDGIGEMPEREQNVLKSYAQTARENGYILRLWATPNRTADQRKAVWKELKDAGVGIIGADNLSELEQFFNTGNE